MKTNIKRMYSIILFLLGISIIVSCNKGNEQLATQTEDQNYDELIERSKVMQDHILDFKKRMEFYRDNPNVKSGGELYTADSAVIELERLLNFNFCYTNIECDKKTYETSEVIMPLDDLLKINDPNLMQVYYNKTIDTIQAQMGRVNYNNMKLLLVDIEVAGYDSNNDAILSVGTLIGNEGTVILTDDSWWYGHLYGTCSANNPGTDAAKQLEARITNSMSDAPASNCHWYFTNINTIDYDPLDHQLDPTPDNYEDYKIYYAIDNVGDGLTNEVKCLSRYEMDFYEYHMTDLAIIEEVSTGKKFNYCEINHRDDYLQWPPYPMYIQHDYTLYIGYRFLECSFEIEDILNQ